MNNEFIQPLNRILLPEESCDWFGLVWGNKILVLSHIRFVPADLILLNEIASSRCEWSSIFRMHGNKVPQPPAISARFVFFIVVPKVSHYAFWNPGRFGKWAPCNPCFNYNLSPLQSCLPQSSMWGLLSYWLCGCCAWYLGVCGVLWLSSWRVIWWMGVVSWERSPLVRYWVWAHCSVEGCSGAGYYDLWSFRCCSRQTLYCTYSSLILHSVFLDGLGTSISMEEGVQGLEARGHLISQGTRSFHIHLFCFVKVCRVFPSDSSLLILLKFCPRVIHLAIGEGAG